jgi:predicted DNA-binding WGR domain protein
MNSVTLTRIDSVRNMRRYYRLDVQPGLFGAWCCIREWGRIGAVGQTRSVSYPTPLEAGAVLDRQRHRKERKGYIATSAGRNG